MSPSSHPRRYGAIAMTLHWVIALAIIANIYLAFASEDLPRPERMQWMGWHKSIGLAVLVLSILRLVWRLMNPAPAAPRGLPAASRIAGTALHHLFYLLIIAVPLAGWMMVSLFPFPLSFFGLFTWPAFPGLAGMTREAAHPYHELFETAHVVLAWGFIVLVPLHILAGLYHHFVRKDDVLLRMLPWTKLRGSA